MANNDGISIYFEFAFIFMSGSYQGIKIQATKLIKVWVK